MKAIYWVIGTCVVALAIFVSVMLEDQQRSVPKIKLSYFETEGEIAESIGQRLHQEISQNTAYWVGVEPQKPEQLEIVRAIKAELEKKIGAFNQVIVDAELELPEEYIKSLPATEVVHLKQNIETAGPIFEKLENEKKRYLFITAALYSNSLIKKNQIHQIKEKAKINPLTVSMAYYAATPKEEPELMFRCNTEDHSGASAWGCGIENKARTTRRKFDPENKKPYAGLMDLIGENDYMLLIRKQGTQKSN